MLTPIQSLSDYLRVFRMHTKSPDLPYGYWQLCMYMYAFGFRFDSGSQDYCVYFVTGQIDYDNLSLKFYELETINSAVTI